MSDEGKVICEKAKSGECKGFRGNHCRKHIEFMGCTKSRVWCSFLNENVKCVPISGEEEGR